MVLKLVVYSACSLYRSGGREETDGANIGMQGKEDGMEKDDLSECSGDEDYTFSSHHHLFCSSACFGES